MQNMSNASTRRLSILFLPLLNLSRLSPFSALQPCLLSVDIDECETKEQRCSDFARCENTIGSHLCFCLSGFTGDGITCSGTNPHLSHPA